MLETRAILIAVGAAAWSDESEPRAKPGDIVYITAHAGRMVLGVKDNEWYRLVNDRDIFCVTEE